MKPLQVGRIGRAHGIRGEVTVTPSTDDPAARFAAGSALRTDSESRPVLTVAGARQSGQVQVVAFAGIADRNTAELLRGIRLFVDAESLPEPAEDEFYDHQLVGLAVHHRNGELLGEVVDVMHPPAAPVLVVKRPDDTEELVPFVKVIVPDVDIAAGRLLVDPPDGMFE